MKMEMGMEMEMAELQNGKGGSQNILPQRYVQQFIDIWFKMRRDLRDKYKEGESGREQRDK